MSELDEIQELVRRYLMNRANRITATKPPESEQQRSFENSVSESLRAEEDKALPLLDSERERLTSLWFGGYQRSEVHVAVSHVDNVNPQHLTVAANEETKLFFASPASNPDSATGLTPPDHKSYQLKHTFEVERSTEGWILTSALPHLDFGPPPVTQADKPMISMRDRVAIDPSTRGVPIPSAASTEHPDSTARGNGFTPRLKDEAQTNAFDWRAAVEWAHTYAHHYSDNFRAYPNDCTNFLSQAMLAGGWEPKGYWWDRTNPDVWFYGSQTWTTSYTWAAAHNFNLYAYNYSGRTRPLDNVFLLQPGDILQVAWDHYPDEDPIPNNIDHSFIVTGRVPNAGDPASPYAQDILLTYHSNNEKDKPLTEILNRPDAEPEDRWYALHAF